MRQKITVGIVGCGAIGTSLAQAITKDFSREMAVSAVFDIDPHKMAVLSKKISKHKRLSACNLDALIKRSA